MKRLPLLAVLVFILCACGSKSGTAELEPGDSVTDAIKGGSTDIVLHEGTYEPFEISENGVTVRAADGEKAVIESDGTGILITASDVTVEGIEVSGGTHGIDCESEEGSDGIENIMIRDCAVHGIRGTHGICAYAASPMKNITVEGCQVYDCETGDSEAVVLNGNVDGFEISGNVIHDNNNIGIDMIGFEGTCAEPADDCARNGKCHDNVVYNISAEGNDAYLEDGEYDLCADGIYVDGGQDIEIYNNFVFNCDIGLEVATEHSPDDDPVYMVSGIDVHDNVVAGCSGWCGMCFGGYDRDLGFTRDCSFRNNTFVDNDTQIGVQRSADNDISSNLFVGSESLIEFNYDCAEEDLVNDFGENTWCPAGNDDLAGYIDAGNYSLEKLFPEEILGKQDVVFDRDKVIDGFRSLVEGTGSSFVPDDGYIKIYEEQVE